MKTCVSKKSPVYLDKAVIYQLFPRAFTPAGTLKSIEKNASAYKEHRFGYRIPLPGLRSRRRGQKSPERKTARLQPK